MNIEPDIFDYLETTSLEPHDDYTSEISYKDQKIIWNRLKTQQNEIERLNNIINTFEDDLEREVNISEQESMVESYKYTVIHSTLEKMLKYFRELKESKNER